MSGGSLTRQALLDDLLGLAHCYLAASRKNTRCSRLHPSAMVKCPCYILLAGSNEDLAVSGDEMHVHSESPDGGLVWAGWLRLHDEDSSHRPGVGVSDSYL